MGHLTAHSFRRTGWLIAFSVSAVAAPCLSLAQETADACDKSQYEAVVDEAGAALRTLNQNHKPLFQEKLRELKEKRGWSDNDFLTNAAPLVKDETIDVFDKKSNALLNEISGRGEEEAAAKTPDCALLLELRAKLKQLVDTQTEKWTYMFNKLEAEMAK